MHMELEDMTKDLRETSALLDQKWVVRSSHSATRSSPRTVNATDFKELLGCPEMGICFRRR